MFYLICKLGCYKLYEDSILPTFGTKQSACFDIYSYLPFNDTIDCYSIQNVKLPTYCCPQERDTIRYIETVDAPIICESGNTITATAANASRLEVVVSVLEIT